MSKRWPVFNFQFFQRGQLIAAVNYCPKAKYLNSLDDDVYIYTKGIPPNWFRRDFTPVRDEEVPEVNRLALILNS